jgi:hypothetical protein
MESPSLSTVEGMFNHAQLPVIDENDQAVAFACPRHSKNPSNGAARRAGSGG